jgi:hypothetical protein
MVKYELGALKRGPETVRHDLARLQREKKMLRRGLEKLRYAEVICWALEPWFCR